MKDERAFKNTSGKGKRTYLIFILEMLAVLLPPILLEESLEDWRTSRFISQLSCKRNLNRRDYLIKLLKFGLSIRARKELLVHNYDLQQNRPSLFLPFWYF